MKNTQEIGSEFWETEVVKNDELFFLSGRTALDFIIRDIIEVHKITVAHIPSLCCHTMIEPFLRNHIPIQFYSVSYENDILQANIPQLNENEIFLYIKYFGYSHQHMGNPEEIKKSGCIVIEDTTHSWLTTYKNTYKNPVVDYSFTSYRKWTGFTGIASAKKFNNKFKISQKPNFNEEYEMLKKTSQERKSSYLQYGKGNKQAFLDNFLKAEELLENNYIDYIPSFKSLSDFINLDKNYIIETRRKNANILLDGISEVPDITPIFPYLEAHDAPLCVPVLVSADIRDKLRTYLISQQIYCPVHWPLSSLHDNISEGSKLIYKSQLSLVCDQRYNETDMHRIINCIKSFFAIK